MGTDADLRAALRAFFEIPADRRLILNSGAEFKYLPQFDRFVSEPLIGSGGSNRCLLTSVTSALGSYALTRLHDVSKKELRYAIRGIAGGLVGLLDFIDADNCVMLDNLPFATVLHGSFNPASLATGIAAAKSRSAKRIAVRGLNEIEHAEHLKWLAGNGFILFPCRRVFLVCNAAETLKRKTSVRRELRLAEKYSRQVRYNEPIADDDIHIATRMYRDLYLGKYSSENADYSESFVRHALKVGLLQSLTLRNEQGALLGFLGFYENSGQLTTPMIGWRALGDESGPTYRILMIELFRHAVETGKVLNWSSGVASFKMQRGGVPAIEYLCIQPENELQRMVFTGLAKFYHAVAKSRRIKRLFDA